MAEILNVLVNKVSKNESVQSIGKTGSLNINLSEENDVDIFIFCTETPDIETRKDLYKDIDGMIIIKMHDFESRQWGTIDILDFNKLEICLMYFSIKSAEEEINDILKGNRIKKEENYFYPVGRCSTLKNINILYDKNSFLNDLKNQLSKYPKELHDKLVEYHTAKLNDIEDIERAITLQDVLFYHFAFDISLDHFLQLLFAVNYTFFPSRKRNIMLIDQMQYKPMNCINRILEIVELGGVKNTLAKSYKKWKELCNELINL